MHSSHVYQTLLPPSLPLCMYCMHEKTTHKACTYAAQYNSFTARVGTCLVDCVVPPIQPVYTDMWGRTSAGWGHFLWKEQSPTHTYIVSVLQTSTGQCSIIRITLGSAVTMIYCPQDRTQGLHSRVVYKLCLWTNMRGAQQNWSVMW